MKGERDPGKWQDAHKVRLYNDVTWPDHNIVCVAIANLPHPRAYSECPDDVKPFSKDRVEEYIDKYRLAMDAISTHCPHKVELFAAVPFGTRMSHIKEGETKDLLSRLL